MVSQVVVRCDVCEHQLSRMVLGGKVYMVAGSGEILCREMVYSFFSKFLRAVFSAAGSRAGSMISSPARSSVSKSGKNLHCSYASFMQRTLTAVGSLVSSMCFRQKSRKSVRMSAGWNGWRSRMVSSSRRLVSSGVLMTSSVSSCWRG